MRLRAAAVTTPIRSVCIYCASSSQADAEYLDSARRLGSLLAERGIEIVYGGGAVGLMGALADGALASGGKVVGVLPQFMVDLEWGHTGITKLHVVDDLHTRKRMMIRGADAVIALPGGSGTLEELLEAITWKRLGLIVAPIVIVSVRGFYASLVDLLEHCIRENFMRSQHAEMWSVVDSIEDVLPAIERAPRWSTDARSFATL
ncbi:MAG: TIGR00730 family Rossman fold protein [Planctomycetota bacterium]|nr:TIGR00730 family Rossman fold protein [Planctomycetota bacterium]